MSWQATAWADSLPYDAMKPLATRVLFKLANVAAQDGTRAYRSKWEMAHELGVDQRSIQRALRELLATHLILIGDQKVVAHLRGDRRPTVYDCNMRYSIEFAQPELGGFDEAEETPSAGPDHGETGLSTDDHGETDGETTAVPLGTKGTTYTYVNEEPHVTDRAHAHENDASGDSLRGDQLDRAAADSSARFDDAIASFSFDACPARPAIRVPHAFTKAGECIDCGALLADLTTGASA